MAKRLHLEFDRPPSPVACMLGAFWPPPGTRKAGPFPPVRANWRGWLPSASSRRVPRSICTPPRGRGTRWRGRASTPSAIAADSAHRGRPPRWRALRRPGTRSWPVANALGGWLALRRPDGRLQSAPLVAPVCEGARIPGGLPPTPARPGPVPGAAAVAGPVAGPAARRMAQGAGRRRIERDPAGHGRRGRDGLRPLRGGEERPAILGRWRSCESIESLLDGPRP